MNIYWAGLTSNQIIVSYYLWFSIISVEILTFGNFLFDFDKESESCNNIVEIIGFKVFINDVIHQKCYNDGCNESNSVCETSKFFINFIQLISIFLEPFLTLAGVELVLLPELYSLWVFVWNDQRCGNNSSCLGSGDHIENFWHGYSLGVPFRKAVISDCHIVCTSFNVINESCCHITFVFG